MRPPAAPTEGGVAFDCDGLLLDSEDAWARAETDLFARYSKVYGRRERRALIGTSLPESGRRMEVLLELPGQGARLVEELVELAAVEFAAGVQPLPGARELVSALRGRRPIGVASNSLRHLMEMALRGAGLEGLFDVVLAGDQVINPKPAPDLYLEISRRLGSHPTETIGLEDTPTGVAAAKAAGLYVIGIPSLDGISLDQADLVAGSLEDPSVWAALGLEHTSPPPGDGPTSRSSGTGPPKPRSGGAPEW
jgi:HAD superfamily hydrolase (TIGR01509 family)